MKIKIIVQSHSNGNLEKCMHTCTTKKSFAMVKIIKKLKAVKYNSVM